MKSLYIFITGASGAGKTTLMQALEKSLRGISASFNYFDDIGIPSVEEMNTIYGGPEKWQEIAVWSWVGKLAQIKDQQFVFLEGSFNPEFVTSAMQKQGLYNFKIICLHAPEVLRNKRLQQRNQPELINKDMNNWAEFLRQKTIELGGVVIESVEGEVSTNAQDLIEGFL